MSTSPSSHPPPPSASPSLPYRRKEPKLAFRIELREKPTRVTQPLPKCWGSLHARLPSLPSFLLSISSRSGDCGGRQRRWPRLAFPLSPVVSASAHSHTQAAAEASDIAPGAEKGIFSSVVNVIYFGMFKCNKGKAGFALPTCMKLGVRCRPVRPLGLLVGTLCSLNLFPDHKLTKEAKRGERAARRRGRRTLQPPRTAGGEAD